MTPSPVPQSPWRMNKHSNGVTIIQSVDEKGGWPTALLIASLNECDGDIHANAELICKAVNNYAPMLELLREISQMLNSGNRDFNKDHIKRLNALLASLDQEKRK